MRNLTPFAATTNTRAISVSAELFQLNPTQALLEFKILGAVEKILWPAPHITENRTDGLWKTTCLEAFFSSSSQASEPYFEINCSPNGDWNAYTFSSYREGMTPTLNITVRLKERHSDSRAVDFRIEIQSSIPLSWTTVGLTAVIEFIDGEKSYWALRHPAPQADFHNKQGWE